MCQAPCPSEAVETRATDDLSLAGGGPAPAHVLLTSSSSSAGVTSLKAWSGSTLDLMTSLVVAVAAQFSVDPLPCWREHR